MIKQIEVNRFQSRQIKCSDCMYQHEQSCNKIPCYPHDRQDGLSVYFIEDDE